KIEGHFKKTCDNRFKSIEAYYLNLRFTRAANEIKAQASLELYIDHLWDEFKKTKLSLREKNKDISILEGQIEFFKKQENKNERQITKLSKKLDSIKAERDREQKLEKYSLIKLANNNNVESLLATDDEREQEQKELFNSAKAYFKNIGKT